MLAQPGALPGALQALAGMVDAIWLACGDTSEDYNWYTKRALLAGVYSATELYMLTDSSPGYADTWGALSRRLDDVMAVGGGLGKAVGQAGALLRDVGGVVASTLGRGPPGGGGGGGMPGSS